MEYYKIRYQVEESKKENYYDILKKENDFFSQHGQIFLLAAIIGYKKNERKVLENKKQPLVAHPVLFNDEYKLLIFQCFKKIAERENEDFIKIIEEYANAGIIYLEKFIDRKLEKFLKDTFFNELIMNASDD